MPKSKRYQSIPTVLKEDEFNEFVLPHLTKGSRGPNTKLTFHRLFNYLLKLMHTGCQWEELPIEKDECGKPEIHYTRLFRTFNVGLRMGVLRTFSLVQLVNYSNIIF